MAGLTVARPRGALDEVSAGVGMTGTRAVCVPSP